MQRVGPVSVNIAAQWNQHVLVNFDGFVPVDTNNIIVQAPPVEAEQRFRVSEISADGGVGAGGAVRIVGTFSPLVGGNYALEDASGYVIADDGFGHSKRGAHIELLCLEDGWVIVAEGCQPKAPIGYAPAAITK